MSSRASGQESVPERRHPSRAAAALALSLWLLSCSDAEGGSDPGASGGSFPVPVGGNGATTGSSGGSGGSGTSGGGSSQGGSSKGGSTTGGSASGGAGPSGGSASGGADPSGGSASGGADPSGAAAGAGGLAGSSGAAGFGGGGRAGSANGGVAGGGRAGGAGGKASGGASGGSGGATSSCPLQGSVTYTLMRAASPTAAETAAYDKIAAALDKATGYYNCHTDITKQLRVSYEPSVATADGNVNGSIRFGSQESMNHITAMHEIGHTLGVGSNEWSRLLRDGVFTGEAATAKLREIDDDPAAQLHGDAQHFWPYGLNYTSEVKSEADLLAHCAMVRAIRQDLYP